MSDFKVHAFVRSDVGKIRKNNEDNYRILDKYRSDVSVNNSELSADCCDERALFSVCDGMGGEECGEVASLIAVKGMREAGYESWKTIAGEDVQSLNRAVCDYSIENHISRMGSTLSNLYIDNGRAIAVNLGDSRVYMFRNGSITRLTHDHDEASRLVNMGILTDEQARSDSRRHQLTQFLGMYEDEIIPEPYFSDTIKLLDGDRFLLVSDGATDLINDEELREFLGEGLSAEDTANRIVDEALLRRGHDNTTVMVIDVSSEGARRGIRGWIQSIVNMSRFLVHGR